VLRRLFATAIVLGPLGVLALQGAGCDPNVTRVGAGGECFVATDCEPGLVCVPQRNGARMCSADLSQVVGRPPAMDSGGGGEAGEADASEDGQSPPADSGPGDANVVDTGADAGIADAAADG